MHKSLRRDAAAALSGVSALALAAGLLSAPATARSDGGHDHRHDVVRTSAGHSHTVKSRRAGDITRLHARHGRKALVVTVKFRRLNSAAHTVVKIPLRLTYSKHRVFPAWGPPAYRIKYDAHHHRARLQQTHPGTAALPTWSRVRHCKVRQHHGRSHVRVRLPRKCLSAKKFAVGARYVQHRGKARFHDTWRNHGHTMTRALRRG